MMDIVVIEDNDTLRGTIVRTLSEQGFRVTGFDCAEEFIEDVHAMDPNMLLIDVNLPGEDGLSLTSRMRRLQPEIGIILMTARSEPSDRRAGYDYGADIYLTKPVTPEELNAAVRALGRRISRARATGFEFEIHLKKRQLRGPAGAVSLTELETSVLVGLARAPGTRLETWQIAEMMNKGDVTRDRNAVSVAIFRVNGKLLAAGAPMRGIRAIRKWGYHLSVKTGIVS